MRLLYCLILLCPFLAGAAPSAPSAPHDPNELVTPASRMWTNQGHREYNLGHLDQAIGQYKKALHESPSDIEAWLNGAAIYEEMGNSVKASDWFLNAASLSPNNSKIWTDLGWSDFHRGDWPAAEDHFNRALSIEPVETYALLGIGRIRLEQKKPEEAVKLFDRSLAKEPALELALLWKGKSLDALGNFSEAANAYKQAAQNDSYAVEARLSLASSLIHAMRFVEVFTQANKILSADPDNRRAKSLLTKMRAYLPAKPKPQEGVKPKPAEVPVRKEENLPPQRGNIPLMRVGIGTTAMGRPIPRSGIEFECSTPFAIVLASSSKEIASGEAHERWSIRFQRKKKPHFDIVDPNGKTFSSDRKPIWIRPIIERGGSVRIYEKGYVAGYHGNATQERHLRGIVEISLHKNKKGLRIVNILDLESYTNGVVAVEMPIASPLEALKAQAIVARTNAMNIKTINQRHKKEGYDVCDGEHCQAYLGLRAESDRSRAVVESTRGRILAYHGRVAFAIYSSNCGGHTQSSEELKGWGKVPYWKGIPDAGLNSTSFPLPPWDLHWWLRSKPESYCMPSNYIYPSHYRWTRIVTVAEMEERINRHRKIGKILKILTLKRSVSSHVNSIRILGSRKNLNFEDELHIRYLLAPGSQRSALYYIETEFGPNHRPTAFIFHGAGWGHAVGMCQSGAMGRAEKGSLYQDILQAYFPGIEIGSLVY